MQGFRNVEQPERGFIYKLVKLIFFFVNFVVFVCGVCALAAGIWSMAGKSFMFEFANSKLFKSASYMILVVGAIAAVISFLGCCSAWKESKTLVSAYFILMLLICLLTLIVGIAAFVYKSKIEESMCVAMLHSMAFYKTTPAITSAWDSIQRGFKCCGTDVPGNVTGWQAWPFIDPKAFGDAIKVPESCCKEKSKEAIQICQASPSPENVYTEGCCTTLKSFFEERSNIVGGLGLGIACAILLGLILSRILMKAY